MALWQANFFQSELRRIGVESEIKIISTKGDRIQHLSFDKIEGKGFFTKEIEGALLAKEIDIAIHSHKDLETTQPEGLTIAGVSYRENPAELLLIRKESVDHQQSFLFKQGATIGTSSARRKSQIKNFRPDIVLKDIRGNVPTRINKLRDGEFDAILLAAAGVSRLALDLSDLQIVELDPRLFVPAAAQGVLAYQTRVDDTNLIDLISKLHHDDVKEEIDIERKILSGFGGGCHIPIGINTMRNNDQFSVRVSYGRNTDDIAKRAVFKGKSIEECLQLFDNIKNKPLPKSVFITKTLDNQSYLARSCEAHNMRLSGQSFIEIIPSTFTLPKQFDWVFFSSSNAVKSFFSKLKASDLIGKKIAAFGESTAQTAFRYVSKVDFIAEPGQPEEVALEFAEAVKNDIVLFPISNRSKKSISSALPKNQVIEVETYITNTISVQIKSEYDAYVFTSPSNVEGFHEKNARINDDKKVVALGSSTAKALKHYGYQVYTAAFPSEIEVFTLLCS